MCRNIKTLYNFEPPAAEDEIWAAALQFVRKISGFSAPSAANEAAFNRAVEEVSRAASIWLDSLVTGAVPKDRRIKHFTEQQFQIRTGPGRSRGSAQRPGVGSRALWA